MSKIKTNNEQNEMNEKDAISHIIGKLSIKKKKMKINLTKMIKKFI